MNTPGPKVILFTGKGGVGKTTTAAATALEIASAGSRVVVTSADPAHSLSDALELDLGSEPVLVAPDCWAQQVDALERMEDSWGDIRAWLVDVFNWAGLSTVEAEELAVFPGVEELVALLEIDKLVTCGEYDVIIVDCAPTAESLRLLSLPDLLDWYMQRLFPASRRLSRILGPVLTRLTDVPVAGPAVFTSGERFHRQLARVRDLLTDPQTTSVRLVMTPEKMVVSEARRTHTYLSLFGYHVDAAVVNRVLEEADESPFMKEWHRSQSIQMDDIEEHFGSLCILRSPLRPCEVLGVEALGDLGRDVWSNQDPLADLKPAPQLRLERSSAGVPRLVMELPNVAGDEVDLTQKGAEVWVSVGPYRRNLILPDSLRNREICSARAENGFLTLEFSDFHESSASFGCTEPSERQ